MRTTFGSSRLVRLLGDAAPLPAAAPTADFAERLSLWVSAFDAIALQAAHRSMAALHAVAAEPPARIRPGRTRSLAEDFQQVRSTLAHAIAQDPELASPEAGTRPWRQRHLELQRQMDLMIPPLREHARQVLSRMEPRLRQLAALDAALEQVLAPREQALLPTVAVLVEARHEQLRGSAGDDWLDAFRNEWRQALLAELDLRLEPVAGLVEAAGHELNQQQ